MSIETIVRQDETWLSVDPVVGCVKDCKYCFLQLYGATPQRGKIIASPDQAIDELQRFPLYTTQSPVMLASETDAFMNIANINYYSDFLKRYDVRGVGNPLAFVTKCNIPDSFIDLAKNLERTRVIFYLSYSGLDKPIEPTTDIPKLKANFERLAEAGLDVIHYWRPFLPQNSSPEKIAEVIDYTSKFAKCTVAAGLKVNEGIKGNVVKYWPELGEQEIEFDKVAAVWPLGVRDYVDQYTQINHPDYPLFWVNSCALTYVLEQPEFNGMYKTDVCNRNHCPLPQRSMCSNKFEDYTPSPEQISIAIQKMELQGRYTLDPLHRTLFINESLSHGQLIYLRQALGYNVLPGSKLLSNNEWGGPAIGRDDIHIPFNIAEI